MKYTRNFNELTKNDAHIAGGKGASLGEMLQHHIPVPDGYVVTANTFDYFTRETDLIQEIDAILDTVDTKTIHTVEHASEKIQALIKHVEMPQDIADEVLVQYKNHNMEYVAVRSSATAEDGADHAWAGQLDSYLNTTEENLLEMVQSCWASLFTPRAIFYRFEKGLHSTHISVAVVIQKMVNSEKSGIAFSVHPVTEDYNQIIIEAGLGLGEAIVSGSVTPDSYVVTKEPLEIIDTNINTQNKALYRSSTKTEHGFNEWKDLSEAEANQQVLTKEQIIELSSIIITIENHYGFPCDIEWAFEDETFYIVQSRPITTLNKEAKIDQKKEKWVIAAGDFNTPFIKNYCTALGYANYKKKYGFIKSVGVLSRDGDSEYIVLLSTWEKAHESLKKIITNEPKYLENIIENIEISGADFNEWTKENFVFDILDKLNNKQLLNLLEIFIQKQSHLYTLGTVFSILDYGEYKFVENNLNKIINKNFKNKENCNQVFEVFTTPTSCSFEKEQELELLNLSKDIPDDFFDEYVSLDISKIKLNHSVFINELEKHTEKWAWLYYSYMGPAYSEKDFLNIIKDLTKQGVNYEERSRKHTDEINSIRKKREKYIQVIKPNEFEKSILNIAEKMVWAKPRRKDYQSKSYYHLSFLLKEIANRLNITLNQSFYCSLDMLKETLENNASIDIEKIETIKNLHIIIPSEDAEVFVYLGKEAEQFCKLEIQAKPVKDKNTTEIKGSTAYKGKVIGIVKIINKPQEMEKMEIGNILVSLATTPDIITAMKKAAAIITDKGGLTCHAAIVARELKIPTIVGTEIATQVLQDGDFVEVDADTGIIKIISK